MCQQHQVPPFSALISLNSLNSTPGLLDAPHHMLVSLPQLLLGSGLNSVGFSVPQPGRGRRSVRGLCQALVGRESCGQDAHSQHLCCPDPGRISVLLLWSTGISRVIFISCLSCPGAGLPSPRLWLPDGGRSESASREGGKSRGSSVSEFNFCTELAAERALCQRGCPVKILGSMWQLLNPAIHLAFISQDDRKENSSKAGSGTPPRTAPHLHISYRTLVEATVVLWVGGRH